MDAKHSERYKKIGQAICYYRKLRGLTQEQLADKLSISLSYLSKIEAPNCNKSFSLEVLFDVSDILNVDMSDLILFSER